MNDAPAPQKRISTPVLWMILVGVTLVIFATPTLIVIIVGMAPSLAAYIGDSSKNKYGTICVAGMNFAGVFYEVLNLWFGANSFAQSIDIVTDVFSLAVMFMAAAFGWIIFMMVPPFIAQFVTVMNQRKIAQLRSQQRKLIQEWGPEIAEGVGSYGKEEDAAPQAAPQPHVTGPPKPHI